MSRSQSLILGWCLLTCALILVFLTIVFDFVDIGEHWVYIALYASAALYALLFRAWLAFATAVALVAVRVTLALDYDLAFRYTSALFAILFLALIVRASLALRVFPTVGVEPPPR